VTHKPIFSEPVRDSEEQLGGFLARFDPAIAELAVLARSFLRAQLPGAVELVYDNYNALALGFCSSERASDCIASVAVFPRGVALSFYYGSTLPDPDGLLEGSGKQNRFVRITSGETLLDPALLTLLGAAVAQARNALPTSPGYTVIKSISARQRPRRPE
jgi:hypothetical protein